jgi:hypothetical protein
MYRPILEKLVVVDVDYGTGLLAFPPLTSQGFRARDPKQ